MKLQVEDHIVNLQLQVWTTWSTPAAARLGTCGKYLAAAWGSMVHLQLLQVGDQMDHLQLQVVDQVVQIKLQVKAAG